MKKEINKELKKQKTVVTLCAVGFGLFVGYFGSGDSVIYSSTSTFQNFHIK